MTSPLALPDLHALRVKLFADGADLPKMAELARHLLIKGFTTNPTVMHKAHVCDYRQFAEGVLRLVPDRPISFEVFSDDFSEMERQALEIASWADNVYVKIPVMNTRGEFSGPLIQRLSAEGVKLNITAVMTAEQVEAVVACLGTHTPSYISVFAGRIADTGRDPMPIMAEAVRLLRARPQAELIWASPRELLNVFQADAVGCHIITATTDILAKLPLIGKDLLEFSLETVRMFRQDALQAGLRLELSQPTWQRP
jgi:transaldolase